MPTLHSLLAVQNKVKGVAHKTTADLLALFGKPHHFSETRKTFIPLTETETESPQPIIEEQKDIQTTLIKEIEWVNGYIAKSIDVGYQTDLANLEAKADVVVHGKILLKNVPSTSLLQLEHRVAEVQNIISRIPTLDPTKGFRPDAMRGFGYWVAREVRKQRKNKVKKVIVMAPATDKHPAQVMMDTVDEPVGDIIEQEWSSLITPAMKSKLLDQVEAVMNGIKEARANANEVDVKEIQKLHIGEEILNYIYKPLYEVL